MKFKGVKEFRGGGWYTYTNSGGATVIIYTDDSQEACASAYDNFLRTVRPKHWEYNINDVKYCHDFDRLWATVALVCCPPVRDTADKVIDKIKQIQNKEVGQ